METISSLIVTLVGALLAAGGGFIIWFIRKTGADMTDLTKTVNEDIGRLKDKFQAFEVDVARNYITKADFSDFKVWLTEQFKEVKEAIKDKADKD